MESLCVLFNYVNYDVIARIEFQVRDPNMILFSKAPTTEIKRIFNTNVSLKIEEKT